MATVGELRVGGPRVTSVVASRRTAHSVQVIVTRRNVSATATASWTQGAFSTLIGSRLVDVVAVGRVATRTQCALRGSVGVDGHWVGVSEHGVAEDDGRGLVESLLELLVC